MEYLETQEGRFELYSESPEHFRRDLVIDRDGVPCRLGECLDPWQADDFRILDGAWLRCVGRDTKHEWPMRAWLERPKGHSKTSDIACMAVWALCFAPRPVLGFGAAGDREQAQLLRDAVLTLLRLNPWLAEHLDVQNYVVKNMRSGSPAEGSELRILATDAGGSHGKLADFFIVDEPSHWKDKAKSAGQEKGNSERFWESILSSAAKRSNCLLVAILNAGWKQHWCYKLRETIRTEAGWYFSHLDGFSASWLLEERIDEQRRLLPANQFNRLWGNIWSEGSGEGINAEDIKRAIVLRGPVDQRPKDVHEVCLAIDLAYTSHSASLVAWGWDVARQKLVLLNGRRWSPSMFQDGKINIGQVKKAILEFRTMFDCGTVVSDRWEAVRLFEELAETRLFPKLLHLPATTKSKGEQAKTLLDALSGGMLEIYEGDVAKDLQSATVVETPSGIRIDWAVDERGHGDSGAASAALMPDMIRDLKLMGAMRAQGHQN